MPTNYHLSTSTVVSIFVVVGIILASLSLGALSSFTSKESDLIKVVDGDGESHLIPLSENGTYSFTTSLGSNTLIVEDGVVSMESADCPNQDCVLQGSIRDSSKIIVCLPHKLIVSVVNHSETESDFT